jgi:hypothetical protein
MISHEIIGEFLSESIEILDAMTRTAGALRRAEGCPGGRDELERGLHTIKGNAATFGFDDFAGAAARVLERVQGGGDGDGGGPGEGAGEEVLDLVEGFIAEARAYLQDGARDGRGYFARLWGDGEARDGEGTPAGVDQRTERPSPGGELLKVLESAPAVRPRVGELIQMAVDELSAGGRGRGAPPAGERVRAETSQPQAAQDGARGDRRSPAEEEGAGGVDGASRLAPSGADPDPHGFALEAFFVAESLASSLLQHEGDSRLKMTLSGVVQILRSFGGWSARRRGVPLLAYLREAAGWAERTAGGSGISLTVEVREPGLSVVRALGRLLRALLKEVFYAVISGPEMNGDGRWSARVEVETDGAFLCVRVTGLPRSRTGRGRLRLYLLQQRIEKSRVSISIAPSDEEIRISVPAGLDGMEMLLLHAGAQRLGVPAHRVVRIAPAATAEANAGGGSVDLDGERLPLVDLTAAIGMEGAQGAGFPGEASLVVVRAGRGDVALKADEVLERQEAIVWLSPDGALHGDAMCLCVSRRGLELIPVLWWSSRFLQIEARD